MYSDKTTCFNYSLSYYVLGFDPVSTDLHHCTNTAIKVDFNRHVLLYRNTFIFIFWSYNDAQLKANTNLIFLHKREFEVPMNACLAK